MNFKHFAISFAAATLCLPALAANTVLLQTPVIYDPNAGVVQQIRDECKIEDMLAARVSAVLAKRNRSRNDSVDAAAGAQSGGTLKLTITHVLGVGGGA